MGFFSNFRTAARASQAATAIQNLLEVEAACGAFRGDTKQFSEKLVLAMLKHPSVIAAMNGGQQPHYVLLACASLSNGVRQMDSLGEKVTADSLHRCLRLLVSSSYFPGEGSGKDDTVLGDLLRSIAFLAFEDDMPS